MRYAVFIMLLAMTAFSKNPSTLVLSDDTTVVLRLPVMDDTAVAVQKELMRKAKNGKPLFLVLNSPGGSINAGKAIIETAKGLGVPVHTISMFSASMSFIISQYLGTRYVLSSSTLMSHRASVDGLSGQVPGSLVTRAVALYSEINEIDMHIASRASMNVGDYQSEAANEIWVTGRQAVQRKFADELVNVRCDKTMEGNTAPVTLNLGFISLEVVFSKCPLLTAPASVTTPGSKENVWDMYHDVLSDHFSYYRFYQQRKIQVK